ncbi:unnamed protein product, partial [marine sediment metagenome]
MDNWDTLSPDPFNPKEFTQRYRREGKLFVVEYSVLEMSDAIPLEWVKQKKNVIPGNMETMDFHSNILNSKRKIWIYTPSNFESYDKPFHLLIVFDGKAFIDFTFTPQILDNLHAEKKI